MNHGSLFSGIGGFDLAAQWMGWNNLFHCEWNEFGQKVLKHYWPNAESYGDITKTDFTIWRGRIDILTGGFPCQPFSLAGKRKGTEDERHLWPEMLRAIREIQPSWIVGENVPGLVNWDGGLVFEQVQADLEAEGYEVTPFILPACGVNAPHKRERIWFIAHSESWRTGGLRNQGSTERPHNGDELFGERSGISCIQQFAPNTSSEQLQRSIINRSTQSKREIQADSGQFSRPIRTDWENFPTQSPICDGNDGIPTELDFISFSKWRTEAVKAAGNAIVPQVAFQIFKAIEKYELLKTTSCQ